MMMSRLKRVVIVFNITLQYCVTQKNFLFNVEIEFEFTQVPFVCIVCVAKSCSMSV